MNSIQYHPARLVEKSECYVVFSVRNPETGRMTPIKRRYNTIKNKKHRIAQARKYIAEINSKLERGWNPYLESSNSEQFSELAESVEKAFAYKIRLASENSKSTLRSREKVFLNWLDVTDRYGLMCSQFQTRDAMDFMDFIVDTKELSQKTHNNYLIDFRSIFNHLKDRGHFHLNPFHAVKKLREPETKKAAFSPADQKRYSDYLKDNDFPFYICSGLVFYCALRNIEITRLKIGNIDLDDGFISLSGELSKTGRYRMIQIPECFIDDLYEYISGCPEHWYLFGTGLISGPNTSKRMSSRISERFAHYRKHLGLPENVTFYSLKDTGGEALLRAGFNAKQLRDHMGHSDLKMTDKYIKKRMGQRDERMFKEFPKF